VGDDDRNGPKRRQTRRLGSRYVLLFLRSFVTNIFLLHLGSTYVMKPREGSGWATAMKTGLNDARCFFFFAFFYILTNIFY
jgi:hypothetical protein